MADSTYNAGTITVAAGGIDVTGVQTIFASQVMPGDMLIKGNSFALIGAVVSNTSLTLATPWPGAALSNEASYRILRTSVGWHSVVEVNARLAAIVAKFEVLIPTVPTAPPGTNTTQAASTAFVAAAISTAISANIPSSSPFPVGTLAMLYRDQNSTLANGATVAGSQLATVILDAWDTYFDGGKQTGTWRNVSGAASPPYSQNYYVRVS